MVGYEQSRYTLQHASSGAAGWRQTTTTAQARGSFNGARGPEDLVAALATDERMILYWIKSAKRAETRARRIAETVRLAAGNQSPGSPKGQP